MYWKSFIVFLGFQSIAYGDLSDVGLTTPEIIQNHGYPAETHKVTTEDGYIISLHRIPYGTDNNKTTTKKASVLIMHGLTASSADFVNMGPKRSLGYILADEGYDVWLGNARGSQYSRQHVSLDVVKDAAQFFNYSFHEIGYYDLAASIDYILNASDTEALHFIGHSQGCTAFLILTSTKPEYNTKIKLSALMAPAAFEEHSTEGVISEFSKYVEEFESIFQRYKIYEIPFLDELRSIAQNTCILPENTEFCVTMFSAIGGSISNGEIEAEFIPVIGSNSPSNTAIKQIIHSAQLLKYGGFKWFSYGSDENINVYGSNAPPDYDLSKVSASVAIFYSKDDDDIAYLDVKTLIDRLTNVVKEYEVPFPTFNHIDFLFAKDAKTLLYNEIVDVMEKYN